LTIAGSFRGRGHILLDDAIVHAERQRSAHTMAAPTDEPIFVPAPFLRVRCEPTRYVAYQPLIDILLELSQADAMLLGDADGVRSPPEPFERQDSANGPRSGISVIEQLNRFRGSSGCHRRGTFRTGRRHHESRPG
jgi:hypothetical protein